jgi:3-methyladenine DNA glycosylase AlkD
MTTAQLLQEIQETLQTNASEKVLASHQKFVPGLAKAYGVPMPVLNEMAKTYKTGGFELVEALWMAGMIEERALAAKLLGKFAQKDAVKTLALVEQFSVEITDWAVCDALGMQSVKPLVKKHAKEIFALAKKLNASKNLWQRRLSLVLVEYYTRDEQYHPAIHKLITALENDPQYYVKKAVVWIKRNFAKGR